MKTSLLATLILLFFSAVTAAQEKKDQKKPDKEDGTVKVETLPSQNESLALAVADCETLTPYQRYSVRYIRVKLPDIEESRKSVFALNVISRSTGFPKVKLLGRDKLMLLRVDMREYAPRSTDLKEWITTWEELQFDPNFSMLLTQDTLKFATQVFPNWKGRGFVRRTGGATSSPSPSVNSELSWWKSKAESDVDILYRGDIVVGQYWRKTKVYKPWLGNNWGGEDTPPIPIATVKLSAAVSGATSRPMLGYEDFTLVTLNVKDVELVRIPAPYLDQKLYAALSHMTGSQAPIVSDSYFIARALSTIQDKGVYRTIYGGLYYQFAGIKKGAKKGTDEDVLLEQLGVGNVELGITAKKIYDTQRSDRRAATFRSKVTGNPRRIDFFRQLAGGLDTATGLISVTHDLRRQDVDVGRHPMANLVDFKDEAREVIWERQNGFHGYALFNNKGELQDEVPPDIASDHSIPEPHHRRLQPAIGCISCHESRGNDGWIPVKNDVKALYNARNQNGGKSLQIIGDTTQTKDEIEDTLDRLNNLYQGEPERFFTRGRDDYAASVLKATGRWKGAKPGDTDVIKVAATAVVGGWRDYYYNMVDCHQALLESGVSCNKKDAVKIVELILQPDARAEVAVPEIDEVVTPEDFRLAALKGGLEISRFDWDLAMPFFKERTLRYLSKVQVPVKGDMK